MAKLSGNYEVVFILNPNLDEEATAAMVAKFKTLVEQNGTLAEVEEWGKRHGLSINRPDRGLLRADDLQR